MQYFDNVLERVLCEEIEPFRAAVGIVQDRNRWLLGLAKTNDDRNRKWCHPGGGIKRGETPERAAVRETKEETGIRSRAVGEAFKDSKHKGIAFVHCKVTSSGQSPDPNHEFTAMGWFTPQEMRSLKLYKNVKSLIDRVR
jgi:8-oxo-dGTP diphosphatase